MTTPEPAITASWVEANHRYLRGHLDRLRLLLRRRVLWLRQQWLQYPVQSYQGLVIADAQADRLLTARDEEERRFHRTYEAAMAMDALEEALAAERKALQESGRPPALDTLAGLFGLSVFERDVLVLCLAPDLDPSFATLYAYVQDDATRRFATGHLAMSLFVERDEEWISARQQLMEQAPLFRFLLLTMEPGPAPVGASLSRPLRLTPRVADYLLGTKRLTDECTELLLEVPPVDLPPALGQVVELLREWVGRQGDDSSLPAINFIGPVGSGKRAVARGLCDRLGLRIYELDASKLPAPGVERQLTFRMLAREAALLQAAIYVDATRSPRPAESGARPPVNELIDGLAAFVCVGSTERLHAEKSLVGVRITKPDAGAQRELWRRALAGADSTTLDHVDALVQQFDFGPAVIGQALITARSQARLNTSGRPPEIGPQDLWQACREQAGWRLDELAQRVIPCHTWEDIVLPEDVYRQLREIASQVAYRTHVYEEWGFGKKLNRGRGISALFSGPSGTGKTLGAEILANHLGLDLYRIDLSGMVSKYIGETEKNLRKVFDAAEQSGVILFFDEADALFGKRSEVKDSHDRYANIEVNYLLQRMEEYRGLAILATNMKSHLDQAFLRRLRFLVDFPFPDASHRARIWHRALPDTAPVEGVDFGVLSRLEVSGGSISSIALNAAFLAAEHGGPITMEHVFHATRREYSKLEKLWQGPDIRVPVE